ncbi:MAG: hypothetical protein GXO17_06865 [Thermodesulfobacteria bacterium]|nr:hypothetical protein [Thermodesulfobacteriota bacterium]
MFPDFGTKTRAFLVREWLLTATAVGVLSTSAYLKRLPLYSRHDFEVLFLLFGFFVLIKGLEKNNLFAALAAKLSRGRAAGYKLLWAVYFLSMLVTNDVALLVGVPLALNLPVKRKRLLVIFLVLAANAGSALTPFGNPQNIFIYWHYALHPLMFLRTIAPFSAGTALILGIIAAFFFLGEGPAKMAPVSVRGPVWFFLLALVLFLLVVLRVFPFWLGPFIIVLSIIRDPAILRVDYFLLLTFFFFFGFTDNLMAMLQFHLGEPTAVFLGSAIASQFISNVPAALLFSDFTRCWAALLWGVNVGGFGSLTGSLANLIAYRFYSRSQEDKSFLLTFHFWSYLFFAWGMWLYFFVNAKLPPCLGP